MQNPKFDDHSQMLLDMSRVIGCDLLDCMGQGRMSTVDLREMVLRCVSCRDPDLCRTFLQAHEEGGARIPPPYCRNTRQLAQLMNRPLVAPFVTPQKMGVKKAVKKEMN